MKQIKIEHCGGYIMSKKDILKLKLQDGKTATTVKESPSDTKFVGLQGNTQIWGYLLVVQALTKKFPKLKVIAVSENFSLYSI